MFPDHFGHFTDIAADEIDMDHESATATQTSAAEMQRAVVFSARQYVLAEVLDKLVAAHAIAFQGDAHVSATSSSKLNEQRFLHDYDLGVELLYAAGMLLPVAVDQATSTGHLMAVCLKFKQLSHQSSKDASVDMQRAVVEEAVLVRQPLVQLLARMRELLEEWPDHPVLTQLSAIAQRVLEMPMKSPLKALQIGIELLLARAQVIYLTLILTKRHRFCWLM